MFVLSKDEGLVPLGIGNGPLNRHVDGQRTPPINQCVSRLFMDGTREHPKITKRRKNFRYQLRRVVRWKPKHWPSMAHANRTVVARKNQAGEEVLCNTVIASNTVVVGKAKGCGEQQLASFGVSKGEMFFFFSCLF